MAPGPSWPFLAHDERDYVFAKKHNLPMIQVIEGDISKAAYEGDGKHINSAFADGLDIEGPKRRSPRNSSRCTGQRGRQLQTPRLDFLAPALLGRADSDGHDQRRERTSASGRSAPARFA
jgi:hypothetical protein